MILILGSNHTNTAHYYKKLNLHESVLVDNPLQDYIIGHSSPQDAGTFANLEKIAARANKVYFAYPDKSEFINFVFYNEYINWIKEFNYKYKTIENFSAFKFDPYAWDYPLPTLQKNDAVFIGCSFTQGVGLTNNEQKYATQVAKYFNLNCVNLGRASTSNGYFFELFSKLDFHPGQLVVLQLTVLERLRYCDNKGKLQHIRFSEPTYDPAMLKIYNNKFLFFETLTKLRLVNQIAESKNLKLAVWLDNYKDEGGEHYSIEQQMYFYNLRSFVPAFLMADYMVDHGTDGMHPGPKSNEFISSVLVDFIERVYS